MVRYDGVPQILPDGSGFIHTDDGDAGDRRAARGRHLVPGERPPERQGGVHLPDRGSGWARGDRERRTEGQAHQPRLDHLVLGRQRADGLLPDHGDDRRSSTCAPISRRACATGTRSIPTSSTQAAYRAPGSSTPCPSRCRDEPSYKRLARTIRVPAGGRGPVVLDQLATPSRTGTSSFVEAHTVGQDDWTTLRDLNGHTSQDTGLVCPFWLDLHPFLAHYQTRQRRRHAARRPGTSGSWWAASGRSDGYEQWTVDLSAYAGTTRRGRRSPRPVTTWCSFRACSSTTSSSPPAPGTTSFEADGEPARRLDGARSAGRQRAQPERLDRRYGRGRATDHR